MRKDQRDGSTDPQIIYHRNLSTEHTEGTDHREFLVASQESLEEICIEMLLTQEIINFTIIFKENP